jgi:hypothetical protein
LNLAKKILFAVACFCLGAGLGYFFTRTPDESTIRRKYENLAAQCKDAPGRKCASPEFLRAYDELLQQKEAFDKRSQDSDIKAYQKQGDDLNGAGMRVQNMFPADERTHQLIPGVGYDKQMRQFTLPIPK